MERLSTAGGIQPNSAFFAIEDPKLRKRILDLIKQLAGENEADESGIKPPQT